MKRNIVLSTFLLISTCLGDSVLSEEALFHRCYSHIVRDRAAADNPYYLSVKTGEKTAVDACMDVFDTAQLDNRGIIVSKDSVDEEIGKAVIKTFNNFHKFWLQASEYTYGPSEMLTGNFTDNGDTVLYITRSLLREDIPFKYAFTTDDTLKAKRENNFTDPNLFTSLTLEGQPTSGHTVLPKNTQISFFDFITSSTLDNNALIEKGSLIGITERAPVYMNMYLNNDRGVYAGIATDGKIPFDKNFGGGLLGTNSFFINWNGKEGRVSDGGIGTFRALSKHVVSSLLCRDLPVLRQEDVSTEVQPDSILAFRQNASCMKCHSTIDPFAYSYRNITANNARPSGTNLGVEMAFKLKVDESLRVDDLRNPPDNDRNFYKRPPQGRLMFRSYNGTLVKTRVEGISELGEAMASTNDIYTCAAKKYFQFFTNIDVSLHDAGSVDAISLTTKDLEYRNFVIEIGENFMRDERQSLRTLIKEIISSSYYRQAAFGSGL